MPKAKKADPTPQKRNQQPPNWPPLRPLLPPSDLYLDSLLADQIYLIRNFLPTSLCKTYTSFLSSLPLTTTPGKPKKDEAVRVNDRFQVEDVRFAEMLWSSTAMKGLISEGIGEDIEVDDDYNHGDEDSGSKPMNEGTTTAELARQLWGGEVVGLNPNIRIYRYSKGQFFAQHYDESNNLTFRPANTAKSIPARTTWTLLIYLTTCAGGETVFYPEPTRENRNPEPISVAPEVGMALLHRHGDCCMLHEGKEVIEGEKWVLRSDLVVAR